MEEKINVLYFVDRMLRGGIQTFVIENIKHMNRDKLQIDFLLLDDGENYTKEENELIKLGCNVYKLDGIWIRNIMDFRKYKLKLNEFFSKHNNYKIVHLHSSSKNYLVLKVAKQYKIPIRIAHSHNIDFQTKNPIKKLLGDILKIPLKYYATDYFACSKLAGEWLFGKKIINGKNFHIIHNAVDLKKFKFNINDRNKIRKELNISDEDLVIGHVGRFTTQKNHKFLIDIFYEIYLQNSNSKLILIGKGKKEEEIYKKVSKLGLQKNVIFEGFKFNVNEYMSAMDIFVFPSLYEGLGLVLIEAQANGLKCFTSKNVVPLEAKVSNSLEYIELNKSPQYWASEILKVNSSRTDNYKEIINKGYDIEDTAKFLEDFYIRKDAIYEDSL